MKKLISLLLCALMLCSALVFPTSAEGVMTAEEFERAFFGDYYITDKEAEAFLMDGCPGTYNGEYSDFANSEYVPLRLFGVTTYYYISMSNPVLLREDLKKYLPLVDFYTVEDNFYTDKIFQPYDSMTGINIISFTPYLDWDNWNPEDYAMYQYACKMSPVDREYFNIKMLYVLTRYMADHSEDILSPYVNSCGLAYDYLAFNQIKDIKGDVNGDGKLDLVDILMIKRYTSGIDSRIALHNADISEDGKIDMIDILLTKRCIAGIA